MSGDVGDILPFVCPSSEGEAIDGNIHWVMFYGASNDVQFSIWQLEMLDIVGYGNGECIYTGGEAA